MSRRTLEELDKEEIKLLALRKSAENGLMEIERERAAHSKRRKGIGSRTRGFEEQKGELLEKLLSKKLKKNI